ncbi:MULTISPECIES: alpha/beta hydrolase [Actinomyces]|uniref:Alpha/beta hydrolase n=1 Tax=Actinomyces respiraculi TaxID=2744574 RepID=A0A7T0LK50_9ACTO|nr:MULTISPECIES: alpha/beta hydrolase [Actinomyces]QPL05132.1 alpha/beta hydrolase [Actinomyces respiraculi]
MPAVESPRPAPKPARAPKHPHPPVGSWGEDLLGRGFRARTLELAPDAEDDGAVATLVCYLPDEDPDAPEGTPSAPSFVWLYLHGWNDYFFNPELARRVARLGGAFYALDLRRYGRSLREGQMLGWTEDLATYDEEIGLALTLAWAEHGQSLPTVLCGHSTGGLTAALWAHRHPDVLAGLVLNSAWLEIQGAEPVRVLGEPIVRALARLNPRDPVTLPSYDPSNLFTVVAGWTEADGELPDPSWADDPYVTGWHVDPRWKYLLTPPIRPGWLAAILDGQAAVASGLVVTCPVLSISSARSHLGVVRCEDSRCTDTVVDADGTARRAVGLGPLVTVARIEGAVHDVFLSAPPVREQSYAVLEQWLRGYVLS